MLSPKAEAEAKSPTGSPLPCRERTPQCEVLQRTYQSGAISNSSSSLKAPLSDCDAEEAGSVTSSVRELQRDRSRARQYVALMRALNSNKTKVVNRGWLRDFLVSMKRRTVLSPFKLQPHGGRMDQLQPDDQAPPGRRARQASRALAFARQGSMGVGAAIEEGEEGEEGEADPAGEEPDAQHMTGWGGEADEAVADLSEEEDSLLIEVEQRLEAVQTPEELDQVLDQMLTGLPEAMKSRLRQMTRFTAARQLKMLAALDPDGYYQNAQVESMLQRLKDSQAGQTEGQQDHSWDRTAIKAATALLLTDYDKRHAAAVAIQRAFRRFRARCEAKGWPSEGRLARLQDLQQLATRFQEEAAARLRLGIMRIPKAGASTAYMLRGDREYRSLLLGNSFVVREEQEQEAVQLSAVEVAAQKLADLWLSDKPMEKARAAMQGMQLPKRLSNSGAGADSAQEALRKLLFTDSMKLIEKIAMAGGDEEMVDAMMKEVKQMADEISSATEGETTGVAPRSCRLSFLGEESEEEEFTRRKSRSARSAPGSRCRRRSSANGSDTGGADDGWLVRRGRGASAGPGKRGSRSKGRRKGDSDRRQKDHDARTSTAPAQASGEHRRSVGKFIPALNTGLPALRAARSKGKSRFQVAPQSAPSGENDADVSRCWLPQLRLADPGPGLKGSAWGSGLSGAAAWAAAYLRQDGGGAGVWPQTGSKFGVGGLPDAADVQLLVRADARPGSEGVPGSMLRDRLGGTWVPLQTVAGSSCEAGAAGQGGATDDAAGIAGSPRAGMGSSMRRSSGAGLGADSGNPSAGSKLGGGAWLRRPRAPPELGIRAHSLAADSLGPEPPVSPGAGPSPAATRSHSPSPGSGMGVGGARLRLGHRGVASDPNLLASVKPFRSGPTGSPLSCSLDVAAPGTGAGNLPSPGAGLPLTRLSPRSGMGERRRASGGDALLSPVSPQPASETSQPFQPYAPHPPPGRAVGQQLPQRAPEGPHTLRLSSEQRGEGGLHDGRGSGTVPLAMGEAGDTPVRAVHPAAPRRSHPGGVSISIELAGLQPSACGSIRPGSSDGRQVGAMPYEFRTSVNRPGSTNRPRSPPHRLSMTGGSPAAPTGAGLPPRPFSRSTCGGQADGPSVTPWVRGHQLGPEYSGTLAAGISSIDLEPQLASAQPQPPLNQQVVRLRDIERAAADGSFATALADTSNGSPMAPVFNGRRDSSGGESESQGETGLGNRGTAAKYGRRPAARQGLVKRSASAATLDPGMVPTPPTAPPAGPLPVQASAGTSPRDVTGTLNTHTPLPTSNQLLQLLRPAPIFASSPPASALAPSTKLYKVTALLQAYSTSKLGPSPVAAGGPLGAGGLALRMPRRSSGNGLVSLQAVTSRSTSSLPVIQAAQQ